MLALDNAITAITNSNIEPSYTFCTLDVHIVDDFRFQECFVAHKNGFVGLLDCGCDSFDTTLNLGREIVT